MPENLDTIYQSGEKIPFNGTFEVVGVNLAQAVTQQRHESAICELTAGEYFPTYQGMEICWHWVDHSKHQYIKTSKSKT